MVFVVTYKKGPSSPTNILIYPPVKYDTEAMSYGCDLVKNGWMIDGSFLNHVPGDICWENETHGLAFVSYCDTDEEEFGHFNKERYVQVCYRRYGNLKDMVIYGHPYSSLEEATYSFKEPEDEEDLYIQIGPTELSKKFENVEHVYYRKSDKTEFLIIKLQRL